MPTHPDPRQPRTRGMSETATAATATVARTVGTAARDNCCAGPVAAMLDEPAMRIFPRNTLTSFRMSVQT